MSARDGTGSPDAPTAADAASRDAARSRRQIRKALKPYGIKRSRRSDVRLWLLAALILAGSAVGAAAYAALRWQQHAESIVGLTAGSLALAGLLVTVFQWRAGLGEKAFDDLYRRIDLANQMWLRCLEARASSDLRQQKLADDLYRFFLYTELDSLEYAIRRYQYGLGMNEQIMHRAIAHFRSCRHRRDDEKDFGAEIEKCFGERAGYFERTIAVARQILAESAESDAATGATAADAAAAGSTAEAARAAR